MAGDQRPLCYPMTRLRATSIGVLSGASGGILLATPVACSGSQFWMQAYGDVSTMIGIWTVVGAVCGFAISFAVYMIDLRMSRLHVNDKRLLRSRRFLQTSFCILFLAACASLIPFGNSLGAYRTDGCEVVGWPQVFFARGGFSYGEDYYLDGLLIDLGVWTAIAVSAAFLMRKGTTRLSVRMLLFLRNALGANKRGVRNGESPKGRS